MPRQTLSWPQFVRLCRTASWGVYLDGEDVTVEEVASFYDGEDRAVESYDPHALYLRWDGGRSELRLDRARNRTLAIDDDGHRVTITDPAGHESQVFFLIKAKLTGQDALQPPDQSPAGAPAAPEVLQPPDLDIDRAIFGPEGKVPPRVRSERRVVVNLLYRLQRAGFVLEALHDGEEETDLSGLAGAAARKAALELIYNLDECHLHVRHPGCPRSDWIYFVRGNEPEYVVCDHVHREDPRHPFRVVMDNFDGEDFA